MRDGTLLRADVWRPAGDGRHPAILQRQPYDKSNSFFATVLYGLEPLRAVGAGFALVVQDTRGCHQSDGAFAPFAHEAPDGEDTIAWVAAQPWSDGSVCMHGASYVGATQLLAATTGAPALRALAPHLTTAEYYEHWFYVGGALQLGFACYWALGLSGTALARREAAGEDVAELTAELDRLKWDPTAMWSRLPLTDQPLFRELCPAWFDWLAHPLRDEWWRATAIDERYEAIGVPALHIGGWSDIFRDGTLDNYVGLRERAATPAARAGQRLLMGPWAHGNPWELSGELDCGPEASQMAVDLTEVHLDFYREALAGGPFEGPPVRIFVMGANEWRDEDEWPIARTRVERLHLRSGGGANGLGGDGALTAAPPDGEEPPDRYVYDPRDPVPTVGGATLLQHAFVGLRSGLRDQRAVEQRADVLVYTSEPLEEDVEVTGAVRAVLVVASSAPDTDFTAKLVDVHPDGRALGVVDGILRAARREGLDRDVPLEPERPTELTIELGSTSVLLRAGHRIRLEVSSSNFPRFARHPNVAGDIAAIGESGLRTARQTVFHDAARRSWLELPVVPARA